RRRPPLHGPGDVRHADARARRDGRRSAAARRQSAGADPEVQRQPDRRAVPPARGARRRVHGAGRPRRYGERRRHEAGAARDGPRDPRAAVHQRGRAGEGAHGDAGVRGTRLRIKNTATVVVLAGLALHAADAPRITLQLTDFVAMPITGTIDGKGQTDGMIARINSLREEPGGSSRFFVNDLNGPLYILDKATFEGTAREILRVALNTRIHPLGALSFDPTARKGDPDWRVLYVGCGDGGSGESRLAMRANPQRLDTLVGKILRIVPDLSEQVSTSTVSENGRYRIPNDNPFAGMRGARKEIWALGLRNPHRLAWAIDPANPATKRLIANSIG